jgi:hypothetical protein
MTLHTVNCAECPRMIVRAEGEQRYPLCAACLSRPGWVRDPLMRWLFEPSGEPEAIITPEPAPPRQRRPRFGIVAALAALIWSGVIGATVAQFF